MYTVTFSEKELEIIKDLFNFATLHQGLVVAQASISILQKIVAGKAEQEEESPQQIQDKQQAKPKAK